MYVSSRMAVISGGITPYLNLLSAKHKYLFYQLIPSWVFKHQDLHIFYLKLYKYY